MRYKELTFEGRNAVLEAFRSGKTIDKLYILDGCQDGPIKSIAREAKKTSTIINYVEKERLYRLANTGHHQGVVAIGAAYEYAEVEDILEAEKNEYNLFRRDVFKTEWLHNKPQKTDEKLFAMSIGRHLGLPCRLIDVTASLETAIWFAVMNPKFHNVDGETILIVLDKKDVSETNQSTFNATKLSYAHEPFMADHLVDLPLGEQRRFVQNGHFIWVDNNSLLNEEQVIKDSVVLVRHFTISWRAKNTLAKELRRDVYKGFIHRFNC